MAPSQRTSENLDRISIESVKNLERISENPIQSIFFLIILCVCVCVEASQWLWRKWLNERVIGVNRRIEWNDWISYHQRPELIVNGALRDDVMINHVNQPDDQLQDQLELEASRAVIGEDHQRVQMQITCR